jgi:hypothetical protein
LIVVQLHLNFRGLVDHVIVGEDETFFIDDHAGAEAALGLFALIGRIEEAIEEILEGIGLGLAATLTLIVIIVIAVTAATGVALALGDDLCG